MKATLRRPLAAAGILLVAGLCGVLAAAGHTPLALGVIAALSAVGALTGVAAMRRERQLTRRLSEALSASRKIQTDLTRMRERATERDRKVVERVEELERRLLAGFEAERQRAAERHREELALLRAGSGTRS
ncbi:hypothetical protein SAMN05216184_107117 [Georgenia satyanarayanai]|uniref:Uncharacterized protein n=1 Tax=Georgenia satyanarayanai TaxID=860221 RepID=A0A2Y9AL64_9MICO|nr:hypothetical protein [Georgenia satyanarayanai]PYF99407.1 hypothetical protein A8987_107117 [Georgenia satyanarayanai]SSA43219.1 hypothetical protein SAMN05216184_107117 [Georgenia satyanarayanai]